MSDLNPAVKAYVERYLMAMRAPLTKKTMFTSAGRSTQLSNGERILLGPNGQKIRVIEDPMHGTQIEHGEHLHAVIRPQVVEIKSEGHRPT